MELDATPLLCSECGETIEESGYVPATESDGAYAPMSDAALCGACGFNRVGFAGCAPELDDVIDPGPDDRLLHVRVTDDGFEVLSAKD